MTFRAATAWKASEKIVEFKRCFCSILYNFWLIFLLILKLYNSKNAGNKSWLDTVKSCLVSLWLHFKISSKLFNFQGKSSYFCITGAHQSTSVAWREKICKHFVFTKQFCLVLGRLKSKISKKSIEGPQSYLLTGSARPFWLNRPGQLVGNSGVPPWIFLNFWI